MVVSHDKWLIENSCQRYWYIHNNQLEEYLNLEDIYQQIECQSYSPQQDLTDLTGTSLFSKKINFVELPSHQDVLLEQLLILEDKLQADKQRKVAHQKPLLQQEWIDEIAKIQSQLGL